MTDGTGVGDRDGDGSGPAGDAPATRLPAVVRSLRDGDETAVARAAVDGAVELLDADAAALFAVDDRDGEDVFRPVAARAGRLHGGPYRGVAEGVVGHARRTGETQHVDDLADDADAAPTGPYRSALAVPTAAGVLAVLADRPATFDDRDRAAVETLATAAAAELDRSRAEAALDEQRDRFGALFDNVPDAAVGYVLQDDEPVVESVNAAFVRTFGHDPGDAVGERLADLVVPGDAAGPVPERGGGTDDYELERVTADGRRTFLLRRVPVGGEPPRGFCIYTDVSELKRREHQLRAQNRRLETFASVVSHDLRNPLTVARGHAELLEEGDHREKLLGALDRMERIVDDVLALARDHDDVEARPVDVGAVADDAWATVATGDATLDVRDPPTVAADRDRLARLLENAFRNAVEHAGPSVAVAVGALEDGAGFYVADDGPGVPPADRERVFEEGYSGSGTTGLGLAIVDEIADAHGWSVRFTDGAAGGARLEVVVDGG